jgi:thiosulfate reductase cytochrome b subunit
LVHFIAIWLFSGNWVCFSPVLVYCVKKNLATLLQRTVAVKIDR